LTVAERNCFLFRLALHAKGEAQKQEDQHKALVKETSARTIKKKAADKTQPNDVRDEVRWLDESDRRDAAANAEGKVISVQESSRGRKISVSNECFKFCSPGCLWH
jgi:hypothetical protein